MRAVVVRSFGGPETLELVELPTPAPGPGQVRIRVRAAAVNPVDAFVRSGAATEVGLVPAREQYGLGWDVAGEVDAVGSAGRVGSVRGFAVGDPVIGLSDRLDLPSAGYAEYLVLDASAVAPAPAGVPFEAAASVPLNALTAAQALDRLDLSAGQTLLVTGAAGAVGGYAVELAREAGLRVVGSASAADEELVRGFGASGFVSRDAELGAAARALVPGGVDGALDAAVVGLRALDAVRGGGAFVAVVLGGAPPALRGIRVSTVYVRADGERLAELAKLVEAGRLTPRVADTFPLEKAPAAHQRLSQGALRGRLVLLP